MPDNGGRWKDLPRQFGSKSAMHWCGQWLDGEEVFERLEREPERVGLVVHLRHRFCKCLPDASVFPPAGGGEGVRRTRACRRVTMMMVRDARGLAVAVC